MNFRRAPLPGLLATCVVLAFLLLWPTRVDARQTLSEYQTTGLLACGGLNEQPCGPNTGYFILKARACDRGLREDLSLNRCVMDTRRLVLEGNLSVGKAFSLTWLGRALRMQQKELAWYEPLTRMSWVTAHNAFNNVADGYPIPNQYFSLTDLLDAGIRQFEWDVHSNQNWGFLTVPSLCHAEVERATCTDEDRDALNIIKELRDWLKETGHEQDVVMIQIEDRMDDNGVRLFNAAVQAYLTDAGLKVFDQAALTAYHTQPRIRTTPPSPVPPRETTKAGGEVEFPSQQYLIEKGFRVVFLLGRLAQGVAPGAFSQEEQKNWASSGAAYPDCTIGNLDLRPNSGLFVDVYGNFVFSPWTTRQVADLTNCNVDSIKLDFLLDEGRKSLSEALEGAIWSWAKGEPGINATGAAVMSHTTGRWSASSRTLERPFVCRSSTLVSDASYLNTLVHSWRITNEKGPFALGHHACASLGNGWSFAPPRTGYDNQKALEQLKEVGVDAFVNFAGRGDDTWTEVDRPAIEAVTVSGPLQSEALLTFEVTGGNLEGLRITWAFGEVCGAPPVEKTTGAHRFMNAGQKCYRAEARSPSGQVLTALSGKIDIADGTAAGRAYVDIEGPYIPVAEGELVVSPIRLSSEVQLVDVDCGPNATFESLMTLGSERAFLECRAKGGLPGSATVSATVAFRDNGDLTTRFLAVLINNDAPTAHASPIEGITETDTTLSLTLVDDIPDSLNLTLNWGDGFEQPYSNLQPGQFFFSHKFATEGSYRVSWTVTDDSGWSMNGFTLATITSRHGGPPVAHLAGPTTSRPGRVERFSYGGRDPEGFPLTFTVSCGNAGQLTGKSEFYFDCRFYTDDASSLVKVVASDGNRSAEATQLVALYPEPILTLKKLLETDAPEGAIRRYEVAALTQHDEVKLVLVTCGGTPAHILTPDKDATRSIAYEFECKVGGGPGTHHVAATVRDQYGSRVVSLDVPIVNMPPVFGTVVGPMTALKPQQSALVRAVVTDPGADSVTVTINWGDGNESTHDANAFGVITSNYAWAADGQYTVTLTAKDADGASSAPAHLTVLVEGDKIPPVLRLTANSPVEATGPMTPVIITATATDNEDTAPAINCGAIVPNQAHGFPVGSTTVTCRATDDAGLFHDQNIIVVVQDTTPPVVSVPDRVNADAVNEAAVQVSFTASGTDVASSSVAWNCAPQSGTMFPVGATTVTCTATDSAGLTASKSFPVVVTFVDTIPPAVTLAAPATVAAASPAGAVVSYTVTVFDAGTPGAAPQCSHASGSVFPPGPTQITCTATDAAELTGSSSVIVTVEPNTVAPVVAPPANITVAATSAAGAVVAFAASATDDLQGSLPAACLPQSGSGFPIGVTPVTCSATDAFGNTGAASFTVTVTNVTTPGEMRGDGFVRDDGAKYIFEFLARERAPGAERAQLSIRIDEDGRKKKGKKRDDRFESRSVDFIAFSDDPGIRPGRQRRPQVDTVLFSGVGEWNGTGGYRYEVFAQDEGEPGRHRESIRVKIWTPAGQLVASFEGELDSGTIQSGRIKH
jgi:hypothetical protein